MMASHCAVRALAGAPGVGGGCYGGPGDRVWAVRQRGRPAGANGSTGEVVMLLCRAQRRAALPEATHTSQMRVRRQPGTRFRQICVAAAESQTFERER